MRQNLKYCLISHGRRERLTEERKDPSLRETFRVYSKASLKGLGAFCYLVLLLLYPFPIWSIVSIAGLIGGIMFVAGRFSSDPRRIATEYARVLVIGIAFAWGISGWLKKSKGALVVESTN